MNAQNWTDTLRLLSMMILVDEKVYQEEVEAFKTAALSLRDKVNPKLMLTRQMAEDWFDLNRDDIAIGLSKVFYESSVSKTLQSLDSVPNKEDLIVALLEVAMSDGRKHRSEELLLYKARETWSLDLQPAS